MLIPLYVLSAGAIFAGLAFKDFFIGHDAGEFWRGSLFFGPDNHIMHTMHEVPEGVGFATFLMMLGGLIVAVYMYLVAPETPARLAARFNPLYKFLLNKWYFDELYDRIFVKPTQALARGFWHVGDATIIDGVPNGLAAITERGSGRVVRIQTGSIAHYAFAMLIGVVVLVSIYLILR